VVAVGSGALSGGVFRGCYNCLGGVDEFLPVDVYIPGCPPRPQAIIFGLVKLLRGLGEVPSLGDDQQGREQESDEGERDDD
jgi:NADH:ubiquinone oxidoreductase subunit B-like Fe-S oxidoreductase